MTHYQKPPELYDGLRLHQNENTGGCSPKVLEALARLRADQIGFYPPYAAATDAVANYLRVPQIGRASCRERVDMSARGASLKTKAHGSTHIANESARSQAARRDHGML